MATWVVTFGIAWLAVRFTPWFSVSHFDGIAVTLALTSTALGALMPILRERSLAGTRVGDSILAYGTWGELGPVLAMSVLLSARAGIETLLILGLFAVVCAACRGPQPLQAYRQPLLCLYSGARRYDFPNVRAPYGAHLGHARGVFRHI